jgi:peptidoglycan/LPS O-acetylase OafA/YrhL
VAYWTLCLELQFYIFYTLLAVLFRRSAERWQLLGFALTVLTSVFLDFFAVGSVHMFLRMWYPFGLGVLVYFVGKNWGRWWAMSPLMICVLTVAICGVLQERSTSVTPAVVAVLLLLQQHYQAYLRPAPRILLRLGRCSYSIFLVHGFLGLALGVLFRRGVLTTELTAWCGIVVFIVLALLCAELYHHFIEKRFAALAARIPVCVDRPKIPIPPLNSSEAVTPNPDSSGSPPKP